MQKIMNYASSDISCWRIAAGQVQNNLLVEAAVQPVVEILDGGRQPELSRTQPRLAPQLSVHVRPNWRGRFLSDLGVLQNGGSIRYDLEHGTAVVWLSMKSEGGPPLQPTEER